MRRTLHTSSTIALPLIKIKVKKTKKEGSNSKEQL